MKRMIIVDDHSAFGQALELVLGRTDGTEVVLARTVEEGKTLIRGHGRFDLAVLDLMLPDGEGTDLVAEVKRHHPDASVAILSAREDVEEVASKAGADAAISKATSLPDIISTLEKLTG